MTRDQAERCVDALFADLRGRRFLKWLFCEHPERAGPILHDDNGEPLMPLDSKVQAEIRQAWVDLLVEVVD